MVYSTIRLVEWFFYGLLRDGTAVGGLTCTYCNSQITYYHWDLATCDAIYMVSDIIGTRHWEVYGSLYYGIGNSGVSCLHGSHWLGLISVEFATT